MDRTTLLAFSGVVLFGGLNGVGVSILNEDLAPLWGGGVRFGSAALFLAAAGLAARVPIPSGQALAGSIAYGVLYFGAGFGLIHWALVDAAPGMTQVVLAVVPLLALIFGVAHGVERIDWRPVLGAVLAVLGVAVVFGDRLGAELPIGSLIAIVIGAAGIAEGTVAVKRLPGSHPVAGNAIAMAVGSALILAASAILGERWTLPSSAATWLTMIYLVLVGSVVVFVLFLYVVERWTASASSYVWPMLPLVAIPFSALLLGEAITPLLLVGGALVVLGVYVGAFARQPRPATA